LHPARQNFIKPLIPATTLVERTIAGCGWLIVRFGVLRPGSLCRGSLADPAPAFLGARVLMDRAEPDAPTVVRALMTDRPREGSC
jgi:hypothetical protein